MIFVSVLLVLGLHRALTDAATCGEPYKRICYYTAWGGVLPNPELCTHLVYSFASIENGMLSGLWSNPFKDIKLKNPSLKTMVAVGGWGSGVARMTEMLKDAQSRGRFVEDSVNFLAKFELDGLDLDFECKKLNLYLYYSCSEINQVLLDPGINMTNRISPPEDKQKFTLLCQV